MALRSATGQLVTSGTHSTPNINFRDSNVALDRVHNTLAEFLIELKLNEEQDKITQIVTGSNELCEALHV